MPRGNGAYVAHQTIAQNINGYSLTGYSPWHTLFPPLLYQLGRQVQADLIHTTPDYGIFFQKPKTPMILTFHNYVLDNTAIAAANLLQKLHYQTDLKWFIQRATQIENVQLVAVSQFIADLVSRELKLSGIKVIYNGIDTNRFVPVNTGKPSSKLKVLFCGNMSQRKGFHLLPAIAKGVANVANIYVATGLNSSRRVKLPNLLHNLGKIDSTDIHSVYQNMDLLLFPSFREGFGLVVAEAMACAKPVVASRCSSLPELIDERQGGYLCEPGNVNEFIQAIHTLAESRHQMRLFGEYNRNKVLEKFSLSQMIDSYEKLFASVLTQKNCE